MRYSEKGKSFNVLLRDQSGKKVERLQFRATQKINHDPIGDITGKRVHETLIVKGQVKRTRY